MHRTRIIKTGNTYRVWLDGHGNGLPLTSIEAARRVVEAVRDELAARGVDAAGAVLDTHRG